MIQFHQLAPILLSFAFKQFYSVQNNVIDKFCSEKINETDEIKVFWELRKIHVVKERDLENEVQELDQQHLRKFYGVSVILLQHQVVVRGGQTYATEKVVIVKVLRLKKVREMRVLLEQSLVTQVILVGKQMLWKRHRVKMVRQSWVTGELSHARLV